MPALDLRTFDPSAYEGFRIKQANQAAIFLILDGHKHWIPDPPTYANLFGNAGWQEVLDVDSVPNGDDLTAGALLGQPDNGPPIYLVSTGQKRLILSPQTMTKYGFDHGSVKIFPHVLIDFIPTGNNIG
jgi:hypothetical protein